MTAAINADTNKQLSTEDVALGFLTVANEAMCRPIRALTEAKGLDAAGGQHATSIARLLGVKRLLILNYTSHLSAYGMALANVVHEEQAPSASLYRDENPAQSLGVLSRPPLVAALFTTQPQQIMNTNLLPILLRQSAYRSRERSQELLRLLKLNKQHNIVLVNICPHDVSLASGLHTILPVPILASHPTAYTYLPIPNMRTHSIAFTLLALTAISYASLKQSPIMDNTNTTPGIQLPSSADGSSPPPPGPKGDLVISDVIGNTRPINIFAGFTRDIDSVSTRLYSSSSNSTILAPLNSAISALPRKPWEDAREYASLGANAYEGRDGEDRARRNLRRFTEAHIVPQSPWEQGEKVKSLGGSTLWWEVKSDGKAYVQPGDVEVDRVVGRVNNGEVWMLKGLLNYAS